MMVQRLFILVFLVLIMSVAGSVASAQDTAAATTAFTESEALNMTQEWASLVSQANVAGLEKLLNDNYMHIHGTSLVETKTQFLEAFRNGSRKYDPIKIEEIHARVFGNSAVVTGKFILKAFVRGKTIEGVNRFGLVLAKTVNGMQVVSFQATAIPQQK